MIELPKKPREPITTNPRSLLIYSEPKIGKTAITSYLTHDGSWLHLAIEVRGADEISINSIPVKSMKDLKEIGQSILNEDKPYKGLIIDHVAILDEWVKDKVTKDYVEANPTKKHIKDISGIDYGGGWGPHRTMFTKFCVWIESLSMYTIYLGHIAPKYTDGESPGVLGVHLTGKLAGIFEAHVANVAKCIRNGTQTILDFTAKTTESSGGRCQHVANKKIVIAESDWVNEEEGETTGIKRTFWDKIYKDE